MNILQLLATDGFIQYNKEIARTLGVDEAIVLGELCLYAKLFNFQEFYFQQDKICYETALSDRRVRQALKTLQTNGIITITKKGIPCKNWYIIHDKKVENLFDLTETERTSSCKMTELETTFCNDYSLQNDRTTSCKMTEHLKEINKEINKEKREKEISDSLSPDFICITQGYNPEFVRKIYTTWKNYGLPVKNEIEFFTKFRDAKKFINDNQLTTDELLKSIENYAKELKTSTFLQKQNRTFVQFAKNIEKFTPSYYVEGCYADFDRKSTDKTDVIKQQNEITETGLDKFDKLGNEIIRNELNHPLKPNGLIDEEQLHIDVLRDMQERPENYTQMEIAMMSITKYNPIAYPAGMDNRKIGIIK